MRDPHYFSEPETFNPERFRRKVEKLEGNSLHALNGLDKDDPSSIVFGFGRRCVESIVVERRECSLFLTSVLESALDDTSSTRVYG